MIPNPLVLILNTPHRRYPEHPIATILNIPHRRHPSPTVVILSAAKDPCICISGHPTPRRSRNPSDALSFPQKYFQKVTFFKAGKPTINSPRSTTKPPQLHHKKPPRKITFSQNLLKNKRKSAGKPSHHHPTKKSQKWLLKMPKSQSHSVQ
jgi:hypothetical protein